MPPAALPGAKRSRLILGSRGTAYGLNPCSTRGAWGRSKGIKGSLRRDPHPFGARPYRAALRVRLPVAPLTPFPLQQPNLPSGSAPAAYGAVSGVWHTQGTPEAGKTRCRPVSAPLNERMTGQGRNAATAGWCGPQPGTGEDSGQTGRTLDAAAAARASRRGSRGRAFNPCSPTPRGRERACRGQRPLPKPAGHGASSPKASLTRVASARPGARCHRPARRYVTKTACVSYLYHVSYLYWYGIHDTRYRRPRYDPV